MKIERERGISVSSSVMMFEHQGLVFNLLDTPGHEDFSEDTYRTLTAADSAIMVLDAAKGIEPQTLKLFEVCRLRDIPITTFINKMDREAQDPFALLDEIHSKLAMDTAPMYWPAASGQRFAGMLDLTTDEFVPFRKRLEAKRARVRKPRIVSKARRSLTFWRRRQRRRARGIGRRRPNSHEKACPSSTSPHSAKATKRRFTFGSALRRFGVLELLAGIGAHAPAPRQHRSATEKGAEDRRSILSENEVTGFVFKIQANMDPKAS